MQPGLFSGVCQCHGSGLRAWTCLPKRRAALTWDVSSPWTEQAGPCLLVALPQSTHGESCGTLKTFGWGSGLRGLQLPLSEAAMYGISHAGGESELRMILVGKSGGGKSATGNTILGRKAFESMLGIKATTLRCQKQQRSWSGWQISVIDTSDMFGSEACSEMLRREIMCCIDLSWPGPHALVFVTQVGRFTAEDEETVNHIKDVFGVEATKHMIVLFTRREDLGGGSLEDYVRLSDNQALQKLIWECGGRFCAFNNRAEGAEQDGQVSELMAIVQEMVQENGGSHYVNELYLDPNLTDSKITSYLTKNRRARQRAEGASWFLNKKYLVVGFGALNLVVVVIILIYKYS
ncbi:GTPase IMAP family member 1-like isoform X3 [Rhineura floridana]|uniref:GTPase IMAP family member 1-like isoform X3 n=2 Tax=Rhineura floridana TaxID=261503 RepID=UPI002AC865CA|nr:GTPase IMAP family member 1-like isoform X3 [Rhineura floridana]